MKLLISAAESSADMHGANLLKAIHQKIPSVQAFGLGGLQMKAQGFHLIANAQELSVMGFVEVFRYLPRIMRILFKMTALAKKERPDIAVLIDCPDFNFLLAKRLKKLGIPMIYYIPPKVWVWRKKRIYFLKKFFKKILCIFPFEESFYRSHGVCVRYVGNPLFDELPLKRPYLELRDEARKNFKLTLEDQVIVLMPGSRLSELNAHLNLMIEAAKDAYQHLKIFKMIGHEKSWKVLIALPESLISEKLTAQLKTACTTHHDTPICFQIVYGQSAQCLLAADAGLIKSGTSTLEAALLQCPHSIIYKPHWLTGWIFKTIVRHKGPVGLVNWILGWKANEAYRVPEILCEKVTPSALSQELVHWLTNDRARKKILFHFQLLRQLMEVPGDTPSQIAAQEIIQVLKQHSHSSKSIPQ